MRYRMKLKVIIVIAASMCIVGTGQAFEYTSTNTQQFLWPVSAAINSAGFLDYQVADSPFELAENGIKAGPVSSNYIAFYVPVWIADRYGWWIEYDNTVRVLQTADSTSSCTGNSREDVHIFAEDTQAIGSGDTKTFRLMNADSYVPRYSSCSAWNWCCTRFQMTVVVTSYYSGGYTVRDSKTTTKTTTRLYMYSS